MSLGDGAKLGEVHHAVRILNRPRASGLGLRALAACGSTVFAVSFVVAFYFPGVLETRAHSFVVDRVTAEFEATLLVPDSEEEPGRFGAVGERLAARADSLRATLSTGLSDRLAAVLSNFCEYDCGEGAADEEVVEGQAGLFDQASAAAMSVARGHYSETTRAVVRDLRIFTGINAVLFLLVLVASFIAPPAPKGTRVVFWILLAATGVSILAYFFVQDWFHTVLVGHYIGYGYGAWVAAVLATLIDWVILRGRISETVFGRTG